MPFGITSDVLDGILKVGIAMYHKSSHRDVLEVLDSSAHLSRALIHVRSCDYSYSPVMKTN